MINMDYRIAAVIVLEQMFLFYDLNFIHFKDTI